MSGGRPHAGDAAEELVEPVDLADKDLQAACNVPPFPGIKPSQLSKSGWTVTPHFPYLMIAHYPKVFRTPAPRFPRCVVRTTWVFREGVWSRIEDGVDVRTL